MAQEQTASPRKNRGRYSKFVTKHVALRGYAGVWRGIPILGAIGITAKVARTADQRAEVVGDRVDERLQRYNLVAVIEVSKTRSIREVGRPCPHTPAGVLLAQANSLSRLLNA
jgi:hypothetical protein